MQDGERLLTAEECAALLRISKRTFIKRMKPGALLSRMAFPRAIRQPHAPPNARKLWAAADVDRWMAKQARTAREASAEDDEDELINRAAAMARAEDVKPGDNIETEVAQTQARNKARTSPIARGDL